MDVQLYWKVIDKNQYQCREFYKSKYYGKLQKKYNHNKFMFILIKKIAYSFIILALLLACSHAQLTHSLPNISHYQNNKIMGNLQIQQILIKQNQNQDESLNFVVEEEFAGDFDNRGNTPIFEYISSKSGLIEAALYKNPFSPSTEQVDGLEILLFDPIYHDQRAVRVLIQLHKKTGKNQWNVTNSTVLVTKFWKQRSQSQKNISEISFVLKLSKTQTQDKNVVVMEIQMSGPGFIFSSILHYHNNFSSTMGYCFYVSGVVVIQILCVYELLKKIYTNPGIQNKISLTSIAICNIEDFYLTMINIEFIMTSGSSSYLLYSLPALCYIILFVIFDMKMLFLVWKSHYMRQIENPQALRKKLTVFYIKFYLALFTYLTLTYFFYFDAWMIILQNLIMLPQIVYNVKSGNRSVFEPSYVLGYLGARILIPFYQRSCPNNHFMLQPMPDVVISLFILYAFMISILFLQSKLGSRFFIPRIFQRDYYDYRFKMEPSEENQQLQCNICLQSFFFEPDNINAQIQQSMLKQKTVMRTPCNHLFHKECLTNWTDVKMQCPTCRMALPPI